MEFFGPAPLGPFVTLAAEMPLRKAHQVKRVEPGAKTGDSSADARQMQNQQARSEEARDLTALRREMERRDLPAGPPPTFQMNLLEVEADIQHVIARVEAARVQAREAEGLRAEAPADADTAQAAAPSIAEGGQADPSGTSPTPARAV